MLTSLSLYAPVRIIQARSASVPTFEIVAYDGNPMRLRGWDLPVVIDLARLEYHKTLVANLDHSSTARVGIIDRWDNDGKRLKLFGAMSAATAAKQEVLDSHKQGYQWEASIEAEVLDYWTLAAGEVLYVNGRTHAGPVYVTQSMLTGCSFVTHGACRGTSVSIAASRFPPKHKEMIPRSFGESLAGNFGSILSTRNFR